MARLKESVLSATNREARKFLADLKRFLVREGKVFALLRLLPQPLSPDRVSDLINL